MMKQENLIKNGIVIIDKSIGDIRNLKKKLNYQDTRIIGKVEFKGDIFKD